MLALEAERRQKIVGLVDQPLDLVLGGVDIVEIAFIDGLGRPEIMEAAPGEAVEGLILAIDRGDPVIGAIGRAGRTGSLHGAPGELRASTCPVPIS